MQTAAIHFSDDRAEAFAQLTAALEGISTALRALGAGRALNDRRTVEGAEWAAGALRGFFAVATGVNLHWQAVPQPDASASLEEFWAELEKAELPHNGKDGASTPALHVVAGAGN